ncbi:GT4_PimA-like domain containing protein [Burkholderiaceae bacterium]
MKILHIIPRWIGGGPERAILEIAKYDRSQGETIQRKVLVLDKPISAPLFTMARRAGIDLVTKLDAQRLESEFDAADIVEVTYWNHPLLLDLLRKPLPPSRLLMCSAIAGNTLPHMLFDELVAFADSWVLSAPLGLGAHLLAHEHVTHIPALANMSRLNSYAPKQHDGVRIVYLGGIATTKLHPDFSDIVAGASSPDIHFDLFGDADPASLEDLKKNLNNRGVLDCVSFHGHVENIAGAFALADIFAYPLAPGSYVTSEKALQEAMWAGIPPVLMAGTAATGWIEHNVTGFICNNVTDFVTTLRRLASDPSLRRRIGQAARNASRKLFDPAANATTMARVYSDLMSRPKRERPPILGAGNSAAECFLQSLGDAAKFFLELTERGVSGLTPILNLNIDILLRGEGGLMHYAKTFPNDAEIANWALRLTKIHSHKSSKIERTQEFGKHIIEY